MYLVNLFNSKLESKGSNYLQIIDNLYAVCIFMKRTFLFVFFSLFLLVGCSSRRVLGTLKDVESYIMERPDSALTVLDTMDRSSLRREDLRAHHALLHAMALDKNFIDVLDDSLASIALKYYSKKGSGKYKARALYYLGLSYYYNKDYKKAIIEFTKAEKAAAGDSEVGNRGKVYPAAKTGT